MDENIDFSEAIPLINDNNDAILNNTVGEDEEYYVLSNEELDWWAGLCRLVLSWPELQVNT